MTNKSKPKVNENYIHECSSELVSRADLEPSLVKGGYSFDELCAIVDFYITNTPIKKSKDVKGSGRWLGDYGWTGSPELRSLEGELLKASGIPMFIMLKSKNADRTIEAMKLNDELCIEHPRAVMTQQYKTTINEDGSITGAVQESRMVCLFRHVRNAIAHGQSYVLPNGNILLDDCDEQGKTASMIFPSKTLVDWIRIVDKESAFYPKLAS